MHTRQINILIVQINLVIFYLYSVQECNRKYKNCCSKKCLDFWKSSIEIQRKKLNLEVIKFSAQYSNDTKPKLLKN